MPSLVEDVVTQLGLADSPQAAAVRTPDFIDMLARYRWPGNVRQLRNYLERRIALGESVPAPGADTTPPPPALPSNDVHPEVALDQPLRIAREAWNNLFEVRYLHALLERHGNNVAAAARAAGVNRVHLYRLLWKHGLRDQDPDLEEK